MTLLVTYNWGFISLLAFPCLIQPRESNVNVTSRLTTPEMKHKSEFPKNIRGHQVREASQSKLILMQSDINTWRRLQSVFLLYWVSFLTKGFSVCTFKWSKGLYIPRSTYHAEKVIRAKSSKMIPKLVSQSLNISCGISKYGRTNKAQFFFPIKVYYEIKLNTTKVSNFLSFRPVNTKLVS